MYSTNHDDSSSATESQDAATGAAGSSSQRQDPGEGMSPPVGQALGKWYGKGKHVPAIINDKGEITGTSKSIQRKLVSNEEKRHSSQKVEGRTELDLVQDEVDEAKRLLKEAHVEVQAAQNKVTEAAFRVGQSDEGNVPDQETVGGELGTSRSMKLGLRKRLLGGIKKTKAMWERWYEAILEEKLQSNTDITVQCIDFCEATTSKVHAVLQHAPSDLRGGTFLQHPRVLVATVDYQENPHLCMRILHAAMFQIFRGASILLRVLAVTESQET